MALDNREIASLIWLAVLILVVVSVPRFRAIAKPVLSTAWTPQIVVPVLLLFAWITLTIRGATVIGLWTWDLAVATTFWTLGTALVMLLSVMDALEGRPFFKDTMLSLFKVGLLIAVFMNFYVFSLTLELLLQPVLALLLVLSVVAGLKEEHRSVRLLVDWLLAIIGFIIAGYIARRLALEWRRVDLKDTLRSLLLPVWLTIGALRYFYVLALYASYDSAYRFINMFAREQGASAWRAKIAIIIGLRGRVQEIHALRNYWARQLAAAESVSAALALVKGYRAARANRASA